MKVKKSHESFIFSNVFLETQTFATSYRISHTLNNRYWSFSAATVSNQLQSSSDENDKLENTAIRLGVGKGFVRDNWSFSSEIELISGPLTPLFNRELEADFFLDLVSSRFIISQYSVRHFVVSHPA